MEMEEKGKKTSESATGLSHPSTAEEGNEGIPEAECVWPPLGKLKSSGRRKDSGQPHRVRHGVLSREVLAALAQLGENPKTYRRLERQFRDALRPSSPWGDLFFDRFWSSYLRLMLVGRLETQLIGPMAEGHADSDRPPALIPGECPRLVLPGDNDRFELPLTDLRPDLLRHLVLAQRYDRHYSREMYRALAVLLLLRRGGEAALETWAAEMLGAGASLTKDKGENNA